MPDDPPTLVTPPPSVRAGQVRALLDGVDLRGVTLGEVTALDRVYVAVRAADWSTVPGRISNLEVRVDDDCFEVSFTSRHVLDDLDFLWRGFIQGSADGSINCLMAGEALARFEYCRIGFCVLHPAAVAGAGYEAQTADDLVVGRLPRLIAPQILRDGAVVPPIPAFGRLMVRVPGDGTVTIESEGEPFEMEDQRNWTDASFKSYIPPIRPGYPYVAEPGQRFEQSIRLDLEGPASPSIAVDRLDAIEVTLAPSGTVPLPRIGLGAASDGQGLTSDELAMLAHLAPDYLRAEVWLGKRDWPERLDLALEQARQLSSGLELALFLSPADRQPLERLLDHLDGVEVVRWSVFDASSAYTGSTPPEAVEMVRAVLDACRREASLAAGTATDFVRLNRARTTYEPVDALTWAIRPTAHADDDRSVIENARAQGITVETARSFAEGRSLCVGPIELSRRPSPVDRRHDSLLAAAWTVASLADLTSAEADAATYYEVAGPRGIIERASGDPAWTRARPRPMYHVFAQFAAMRGGLIVRPTASGASRSGAVVAVSKSGDHIGMAANTTARTLRLSLGLFSGPVSVAVLDDSGQAQASLEPHFLSTASPISPQDECVAISLAPYAVAFFRGEMSRGELAAGGISRAIPCRD